MRRAVNRSAPILALLVLSAGLAACEEEEPLPETPPRQISESTFLYPEELWDERIEGQTTLRVYVNPIGSVDSAVVDQTSGYEAFDSAALQGAYLLRFAPARRGTDSVGVWVLLPVQFDMANAAAEPQEQP